MTMLKFKRFASLILALTLSLSFAVLSASAADIPPAEDPLLELMLAADDCEIRNTRDGSAQVITATLTKEQVESLPAAYATAASNTYTDDGIAAWNAPGQVTFRCRNGFGKSCTIYVTNEDETADMKVVHTYIVNGDTVSTTEYVHPKKFNYAYIRSNTDADLTCTVTTTITPDTGWLTVGWSYSSTQFP